MFRHTFQIRWVDTDAAEVMHYSNYFRYFEACEEEYYRSLGLNFKTIYEKYGIGPPRVEAHCTYRSPCRFGDAIEVTLGIRDIKEKTITYEFHVYLKNENRLAAEGHVKCIAVNEDWKAVPIPDEFVKIVQERRS